MRTSENTSMPTTDAGKPDTGKPTVLGRIEKEQAELQYKLTALRKMLDNPIKSISKKQLSLLRKQAKVMSKYNIILINRLDDLKKGEQK